MFDIEASKYVKMSSNFKNQISSQNCCQSRKLWVKKENLAQINRSFLKWSEILDYPILQNNTATYNSISYKT